MKIIAFGASPVNIPSIKLATYAAHLFENAEVEVLDLNDFQMPYLRLISKRNWSTRVSKAF
jgi:hypothetical protein